MVDQKQSLYSKAPGMITKKNSTEHTAVLITDIGVQHVTRYMINIQQEANCALKHQPETIKKSNSKDLMYHHNKNYETISNISTRRLTGTSWKTEASHGEATRPKGRGKSHVW